jgi:hypothetical protein
MVVGVCLRLVSSAVVDIFPHQTLLGNSSSNMNASNMYDQIPGDKSTKQIRIYPASRPVSQASAENSIRSKASSRKGSGKAIQPRIFRALEMGDGD